MDTIRGPVPFQRRPGADQSFFRTWLAAIVEGGVLALVRSVIKNRLQQRLSRGVEQQAALLAPEEEAVIGRLEVLPAVDLAGGQSVAEHLRHIHMRGASPRRRYRCHRGRNGSNIRSDGGCGPCGASRRRCNHGRSAGRHWGCGHPGSILPPPRTPPGSICSDRGSAPASIGPGGSSICVPGSGGGGIVFKWARICNAVTSKFVFEQYITSDGKRRGKSVSKQLGRGRLGGRCVG